MSSCSKTGWRASWVSSHPTCACTQAQRSALFRKERKESVCLGELAPLFGLLEGKILHFFSKRRVPYGCDPRFQFLDTVTEFHFLGALVDLSLYLIRILGQIYITNTRRPR